MKFIATALGTVLGLGLTILAIPAIALAAEAGTTVSIPVGTWVSDWMPIVSGGLAALVAWALRQLPSNLIAILGNGRVELLINNAIGYGLNAVAGAAKGKTLSADVGNKVLAEALQYAIDNAPGWLTTWAGGPEGLAKKIWGRLNLAEDADGSIVQLVTATAQVKS
jgi:hypothetical protein